MLAWPSLGTGFTENDNMFWRLTAQRLPEARATEVELLRKSRWGIGGSRTPWILHGLGKLTVKFIRRRF